MTTVWLLRRLIPAGALSGMLAQVTPADGWAEIIRPFGVAAPFALLCLFGAKELWSENRRLLGLLLEAAPALADSNKALAENTETLASVTVLMHSLAGRPSLDATDISIVRRMLREWDERPSR